MFEETGPSKMRKKTIVNHWHYMDGWCQIPEVLKDKSSPMTSERYFDEGLVGWHCWVYAADDKEFNDWMEQNMKGEIDVTFRFNSGDPMHTVLIKDNEDATLFKLKWM